MGDGRAGRVLGRIPPGAGRTLPVLGSAGWGGSRSTPFLGMGIPMPPKGSEGIVMCMMVSLAQKPPLLVRSSTRFTTWGVRAERC